MRSSDGLLAHEGEGDRQMGYCHMEVDEIARWVIVTWRWMRSIALDKTFLQKWARYVHVALYILCSSLQK